MQDTSIESAGPQETEAAGAALASRLKAGDLVLIRGELGAGKTTFVRGAARALGVTDPVTSPTFSIGHRYAGEDVGVSHIDLYRVGALDSEEPDLLDAYLDGRRIAFVEWPADADAEFADPRARVTIEHAGADRRLITVQEDRR